MGIDLPGDPIDGGNRFAIVGAVAIAALPPLNGFVSEWLTFQAVLLSPVLPHWGLKIMVPAVGGLLALATALAASHLALDRAQRISALGALAACVACLLLLYELRPQE